MINDQGVALTYRLVFYMTLKVGDIDERLCGDSA